MTEPVAMKPWLMEVPTKEREHYLRIGMLSSLKPGAKSALVVVDVTYGFCGSEGLTLDEAVKEFSSACGPASWEAMPRVAQLIQMFRDLSRPIIYTYADPTAQAFTGTVGKGARKPRPPRFNDFPAVIAPQEGDWVMGKAKASGFFQTPLSIYLTKQNIDTVVICGVSTSGCVRATGVDCSSHGYTTFVVDDCCFDRSYYAHCANLFDLHAKYATVLSLNELATVMGYQQAPAEPRIKAIA